MKKYAVAEEADLDEVWDHLAAAVSRMFDRECEVADDFFAVAATPAFLRTFRGNNTKYLYIGPYVPNSITVIEQDGEAITLGDTDVYTEQKDYLVFSRRVLESSEVEVTARFGFAAIAPDVIQACIEQALFMWRRKDLAFAELSGVSAAAITSQFAPTFEATAQRYRDLYSENKFFA